MNIQRDPEYVEDLPSIMTALSEVGFACTDELAYILYSRFCLQQASNWQITSKETLNNFVRWINEGMDPEDAGT